MLACELFRPPKPTEIGIMDFMGRKAQQAMKLSQFLKLKKPICSHFRFKAIHLPISDPSPLPHGSP